MPAEGGPTEGMPSDAAPPERRLLSGWGATAPTTATVVGLDDPEVVATNVVRGGPRGTIARGYGRSYGDPAQNAGGVVVDATASTGLLSVDLTTGVVVARAGTSIDQLIRWLVPLGWFVPVTPGTR